MTKPAPDAPFAEQAEYWVVRLASGEIEPNELAEFKVWQAARPGMTAASLVYPGQPGGTPYH